MKKFALIQRTFILVFLICSVLNVEGQNNNIRFNHLSLNAGLSQSSVNCLIQDKKGFMWFGTQDGLNRFDGYNFKIYFHDIQDTGSLTNNFVRAIFEDSKGNLWVGTDGGLNIFDPASQSFQHFLDGSGNGMPSTPVFCINEDFNGNIWVGSNGNGIFKLTLQNPGKGNKKSDYVITNFQSVKNPENGLRSNVITTILEDSHKNLWIGSNSGLHKFSVRTETFINYNNIPARPNSLSSNNVTSLYEDANGTLWVGTESGLDYFDRRNYTFRHFNYDPNNFRSISSNRIKCIYQDKAGALWIGTDGGGLNKFNIKNNSFTRYQVQSNLPNCLSSNTVFSVYEDRSGSLWIGTDNGINKFDRIKQNFVHYQNLPNNSASLNNNSVWSIYEDRNNILWVGTSNGLNKIDRDNSLFTSYEHIAGNGKSTEVNKSIFAIVPVNNSDLLIGTDNGLYLFNKQNGSAVKVKSLDWKSNDYNNSRVYCIRFDNSGNIWIGTREGLLFLDKNRKKFHLFQNFPNVPGSISNNVIRYIHQDGNGAIWIATNGGGLNKIKFDPDMEMDQQDPFFEIYKSDPKNPNSLNNNAILSIYEDRKGIFWLGTYGGGLNKFDPSGKGFRHFTERNGLANNVIYGIIADKENDLWISTNKGISKFDISNETFRNFYENDGLQSNEFNIGAYAKSNSGELFFGGINGFNAFYPDRIKFNKIAPQIAITDFQLFNKSIRIGENEILSRNITETSEIVLPYKLNVFSIEFSSLHYSYPEKNQYAYMLEGLDEDWNYVGSRRTAPYTKLDPGKYVFKVKGSNSDGTWTLDPATLTIIIKPPFWKTIWFRALVVLLIIGGSFAWYKFRINSVENQKRFLEEQVRLRTGEIMKQKEEIQTKSLQLANEKEKVEKLLLNILPQETVEELKTKGKASARHYRTASVMFTDFKGFTQISERLRPKELVEELDRCFIKFDEIIEKYNIEKIKTIGDSYMCTGGVPIRNKSNPIDIVLAGLEIQRYISELQKEKISKGQEYWELRIGIHTGDLIAGVVGIKRFAYDVWGDTVNIASRLESTSEVGKVNISGTTWTFAKEFFICSYRGKIAAKNKGEIDMYFVESIRPELSINGEGIIPNEDFGHRLEHILFSKINYKKAEHHIVKLLSENLPPGLFYHGLHHTLEVCKSAEEIANLEGIGGEDLFLLKTAALFHDAGFIKTYDNNEPHGVEMSKHVLPEFGYSPKQIEIIGNIILATQIPQKPNTILERIMCDADLDYLGTDSFHPIADTLRRELMLFGKIGNEMKHWDELQINFLTRHKYFTDSSKSRRGPVKDLHVQEIIERLRSY